MEKARILLQSSLARYVLVGGGAFVAEYVSFWGLYYGLSIWLALSNGISFGIGLLTSFILNRIWSFSHHEYKRRASHQLGLYIVLAGINLLATIGLVSLLGTIDVVPAIGKLAAMLITSSWNFIIFKKVIFSHKAPIR